MNRIAFTHDSPIAAQVRRLLGVLHEHTGGECTAEECLVTLRTIFETIPPDTIIETTDEPGGFCRAMSELSAKLGVPRTFEPVKLYTGNYL